MKPIVKRTVWSSCLISIVIAAWIFVFEGKEVDINDILAKDRKAQMEVRKLLTAEQQEVIMWIESNGGSVHYNPGYEIPLSIDFNDAAIGDMDLSRLDCFSEILTWLSLSKTKVSSDGLKLVGKWPRIDRLFLDGSQIDDTGLYHLRSLLELVTLGIGETEISGEGLQHLHALPNLTSLYLDNTQINDEGLKHVAGIRSLKELSIDDTAITAVGLAHLKDMPNLRSVALANTGVSFVEDQLFRIYLPANKERDLDIREHYEKHGELPYTQEEWERDD